MFDTHIVMHLSQLLHDNTLILPAPKLREGHTFRISSNTPR